MAAKTFEVKFDEGRIDKIFARVNQSHFAGAAVGVAIQGRPVYRKGFGLANMELPVLLSPTIRMRIGSTTKHFACLAYLLLCEEGLAGIDDSIRMHLPELHPITHDVTMRQLMGNLSGLRDALDIIWQFNGTGRAISSAQVLGLYRDIDDVNAAPGSAWIYNNGGWVILSAAIERIADKSLDDVLQERIFEPVEMYDTLLRRWDTDFVPNSAALHMTTLSGGFEKSYIGTEDSGEGGMVSTVNDMLRWLAHMDTPVVGTADTWKVMRSPQTLANGTSTGYGLGLMIGTYRGVPTVSHSGGVMGGNAQMLKVPAAGLDIVIMVNRHDVLAVEFAEKIMDACLPGLDQVRPISSLPPVTGCFRSSRTGRVVSFVPRDGRQFASIDGYEMPVECGEDGLLWPVGIFSYVKQAFRLNSRGLEAPATIQLNDFGTLDDLHPVQSPTGDETHLVEGRYRSDSTGIEVSIDVTDGDAQMVTTGRFGAALFDLECVASGVWRAKSRSVMPWGGMLSFDTRHSQFHFSNNWRTRSLPFRRFN